MSNTRKNKFEKVVLELAKNESELREFGWNKEANEVHKKLKLIFKREKQLQHFLDSK